MNRDMGESVAGFARPLRRAAVLVWVRSDQEAPRSSAADLIIFALLCTVARESSLYLCMSRDTGYRSSW